MPNGGYNGDRVNCNKRFDSESRGFQKSKTIKKAVTWQSGKKGTLQQAVEVPLTKIKHSMDRNPQKTVTWQSGGFRP